MLSPRECVLKIKEHFGWKYKQFTVRQWTVEITQQQNGQTLYNRGENN